MEYFAQLPNILYTFDPNQIEYTAVKDIFSRTKIIDAVLQNSLVYYQYGVKEGDNAEIVAHKYYGDTKRHWIVFFANQVVDPYFDMPLKSYDLDQNIIAKYGTLANAQAHLHHVEQHINVTTTFAGISNTDSYVSTLEQPYTYNFLLKQVQSITLPSISTPMIDLGSTSVTLVNGVNVTTSTKLYAISNYDYEITENEKKRNIQLLDSSYATSIEQQLTSLLSQ